MKQTLIRIWLSFINMPEQTYNKIYKLALLILFAIFIGQLSGIKTELKRIAFSHGGAGVFLMEQLETRISNSK